MPGSPARRDRQDFAHEGGLSAGRPMVQRGAAAGHRGRCAGPVDIQRLAEIRNRALLVTKPHPGLASIVPGIGIGRVALQRPVVIGKAVLVVALVEPDHAAVAPATRSW